MLEKLKSRKFLLALFSQFAGLAVLFYPEFESQITEAVTKGGALLLMALTASGWISAEASVDAARENNKAFTGANIDKLDKLSMVALCAVLLFGAGGCVGTGPNTTPEDRWYEARSRLNTANSVFVAWARTQDLTDPDAAHTAKEWGEALQTARFLLNESKLSLPDGGDTFDAYLQAIERALLKLEQEHQDGPADFRTDPQPDPPGPVTDERREHFLRPAGEWWRDLARAA